MLDCRYKMDNFGKVRLLKSSISYDAIAFTCTSSEQRAICTVFEEAHYKLDVSVGLQNVVLMWPINMTDSSGLLARTLC